MDDNRLASRVGGRRFLAARIAAFIAGLILLAYHLLSQVRPGQGAVEFQNWVLVFGLPFGGAVLRVHYWLLVGLVLALTGALLTATDARRVADALVRRSPLAASGAVLFLVLSLLPLTHKGMIYSPPGHTMLTTLLLGSAAFILIVWALKPVLGRIGAAALRVFAAIERPSALRFAIGVGFITLALAVLVNQFAFKGMPHITDGIAQLFQGRIFASGHLSLPSPAFRSFFDFENVVNNGRWFCQYPPGYPFFLALGVLVGMPWLINALFGALGVIVIYLLGRLMYSDRVARLAAALAALSPFLLLMSAGDLNHPTSLLFGALFLLCWIRLPQHGLANALLGGLSLGIMAMTRPFTAAAMAVPVVVWTFFWLIRRPAIFGRVLACLAGLAASGVLFALYNRATTGNPMTSGYSALYGSSLQLGFGHETWGVVHTPWRGFVHMVNNLNGLNAWLFAWPLPSLLFALVPVALGLKHRWDRFNAALIASIVLAHIFYFFHAHAYGPRFIYECLPALVLLTARGIFLLGPLGRWSGISSPPSDHRRAVAGTVALMLIIALLVSLPITVDGYRRSYRTSRLVALARRLRLTNALVFSSRPNETFLGNKTDLFAGSVVFANDLGSLNPALSAAYPDRRCYIIQDDTILPAPEIAAAASALQEDLDSAWQFIRLVPPGICRTILWPLDVLPDTGGGPRPLPGELLTARERDQQLNRRDHAQLDFLPALSVWVRSDPRKYYGYDAFRYEDSAHSYVAGGYGFQMFYAAPHGLVYVFRVAPADDGALPFLDVTRGDSLLRSRLLGAARSAREAARGRYRWLFWPDGLMPDSATTVAEKLGPIIGYKDVYRLVHDQHYEITDLLPALALWVIGRDSGHAESMRYMSDCENYVSAGLRFTFIGRDPDGLVAAYLVEPVSPP